MPTVRIVPSVSGEHVRISATSFMTYRKCPEQGNQRFQGEYGPSSRVSLVGSLAHQVFRKHLVEGAIDVSNFAATCKAEIGSNVRLNNTLAELRLKPSALDGVIEEVRSMYQRFVDFPSDGFVGAEVGFDIEPADGVQLIGRIDAVFDDGLGGHRLVDWKTGEMGEVETQLLFYALLWALDRGELPATLEAVSVGTGERYNTTPTSPDLARVAADVTTMVDELRSKWAAGDEFARRGGPWCRYCPVLETCPEGSATMKMLG